MRFCRNGSPDGSISAGARGYLRCNHGSGVVAELPLKWVHVFYGVIMVFSVHMFSVGTLLCRLCIQYSTNTNKQAREIAIQEPETKTKRSQITGGSNVFSVFSHCKPHIQALIFFRTLSWPAVGLRVLMFGVFFLCSCLLGVKIMVA